MRAGDSVKMTALGLASVHLHNRDTNAESESRTATFPVLTLLVEVSALVQEEATADWGGGGGDTNRWNEQWGREENRGWRSTPRKTAEFSGWLELLP